jgi:hypothetical protein
MNSRFNTIDPNQSKLSDLAVIEKVISEKDRLPEKEHEQATKAFLLSDSIASGIARDFAFVKKIPQYIKEIIENKLWECLYVAKGVTTPYYCRYTKGTDSENFRAFITAKRPNGLETTVDEVDNLLNSNPEIRWQFRTLIYESRQGERTDLTEETSRSDCGKFEELSSRQQENIRASNRAAEAIPILKELLDRGLIAIDIAAKLGRDIKDPDNLTADEREYVEDRDLIGLRINQYIDTNIIPEDEYKEPAYRRELNRFVKDLLGLKDRSKSVRMDNPKKAADKLLQFYQGDKLKTLIDYLRQGLTDVSESSVEKTVLELSQEVVPKSAKENGKIPVPDNIKKSDTSKESEIQPTSLDSDKDNQSVRMDSLTKTVNDSPISESQETQHKDDSEDMRLTSSELAKRLGLKQRSFSNAVANYGDKFPEWSKKRDPDGISWQKSDEKKGSSRLFIPVDTENTQTN